MYPQGWNNKSVDEFSCFIQKTQTMKFYITFTRFHSTITMKVNGDQGLSGLKKTTTVDYMNHALYFKFTSFTFTVGKKSYGF